VARRIGVEQDRVQQMMTQGPDSANNLEPLLPSCVR